jgi:hypothetical protein
MGGEKPPGESNILHQVSHEHTVLAMGGLAPEQCGGKSSNHLAGEPEFR